MSSDREASSFHTKRYLHKSGRSSKVYGDNFSDGDGDDGEIVGTIRQTDM